MQNGAIYLTPSEIFAQRLVELQKGMELADKYCSYDTSIFYFIINRHLGDARRGLRMLRPIKMYYGEKADRMHDLQGKKEIIAPKKKLIKKLVVLTTDSLSGVAKLFLRDIDEIIVLKKWELKMIEFYASSSCAVHQNIICDFGARIWIQHNELTDEGPLLRSNMFGISELMWDLCLPCGLENQCGKMEIAPSTAEETKKYMIEHGLVAEKTAICCPAAKSSSMLDSSVWEKIVNYLQNKGYTVLTNTFGDESPIKGTESITVPVDIIACMAMQGCVVLGVQSGLIDVLAECNPENLYVFSVIKNNSDKYYARSFLKEVNRVKNITYLRIEHFEEDYVLKLLADNFH